MADPVGFAPWAGRWVIDEVQRGGEPLARSIKQAVDLDPSPGQFVLTGSPDFLTAPTVPESLAGRAGFVEVWPFTQGEATGAADRFIDGLFAGPAELAAHRPSRLNRRGLLERVCTGGYPEVHRLPARQRPGYCAPASAMPALRR